MKKSGTGKQGWHIRAIVGGKNNGDSEGGVNILWGKKTPHFLD